MQVEDERREDNSTAGEEERTFNTEVNTGVIIMPEEGLKQNQNIAA